MGISSLHQDPNDCCISFLDLTIIILIIFCIYSWNCAFNSFAHFRQTKISIAYQERDSVVAEHKDLDYRISQIDSILRQAHFSCAHKQLSYGENLELQSDIFSVTSETQGDAEMLIRRMHGSTEALTSINQFYRNIQNQSSSSRADICDFEEVKNYNPLLYWNLARPLHVEFISYVTRQHTLIHEIRNQYFWQL